MKRRSALLALFISCAALSGCSRDEAKPVTICPDADAAAAAPVDPALYAFLSRSRAAHHVADGHEQDKRYDKAINALDGVINGPKPKQPGAPEVREVLADTRARLADLKSRLGKYAEAEKDISEGLKLATETTYFRGHLFEVRGLLEERRAKSLKDQGNEKAAEAAKQRALEAFEESMNIQSEVIKESVPGGGP